MKPPCKPLFLISLCEVILLLSATAEAQPSKTQSRVELKRTDNVRAIDRAAQPQVSELRCRGGASSFTFEKIGNDRQLQTGEVQVVLRLIFKASANAAGVTGGGLEPGTCSWVDRTLNNKEPREIWFDTLANAQLKQALKGTGVDRSPTAAETYPDAITIPAYLENKNHYFSFFVVNALSQYFAAQSYGHWKPSIKDLVIKPNDISRQPASRRVIKH